MGHKVASLIFLICLCLFSFSSCNSRGTSTVDSTSRKIDSLIVVREINERCILIKFGPEAVTAISTKKGIVVVDAGISTEMTSRYRKIIENTFHRSDFAYVINTHAHPDHYGGNSVFHEAGIVGHVNCLREIARQRSNPEKVVNSLQKIAEDYEMQLQASDPDSREWNDIFVQKTRYQSAYNDAKKLLAVRMPDITFSDSMNIEMGDISLKMFYFGKCHSESDIMIFVPEMKILFTGDLINEHGRPSISDRLMTDRERWRQSVYRIEKIINNIEIIIGGHGQIITTDDLRSFNSRILARSSKK